MKRMAIAKYIYDPPCHAVRSASPLGGIKISIEVIKHRAEPRVKNLSIDAVRAGPKCGPKSSSPNPYYAGFAGLRAYVIYYLYILCKI